MQDLLVVRGRETREHVVQQRGDTRDFERSRRDLVGHGAAGQALHDDEEDVAVATEVVHGDDVRMLDRSCGLRFAFEAGQRVVVAVTSRVEQLHRHLSTQAFVDRAVHDRHAAPAEPRPEPVTVVEPQAHAGARGWPEGVFRFHDRVRTQCAPPRQPTTHPRRP